MFNRLIYSSSVYVFLQQILLEVHVHLLHLIIPLLFVLQSLDGLLSILDILVQFLDLEFKVFHFLLQLVFIFLVLNQRFFELSIDFHLLI